MLKRRLRTEQTQPLDRYVAMGYLNKGRRIAKAMLPLTTVLERGGKFVQCVKYACELRGLPSGSVRLPLRPMKKELKREMRDALETSQITISESMKE